LFPKNEIEKALRGSGYSQFQDDPIGFAQEVLAETLPGELKELMVSVRDNPVTIAQSCNAFGKTFAAGRVAIWWYKCFQGAQVYTAAAPPESNLKRLLWGEILSVVNKHPDMFESDSVTTLNVTRNPQEFIAGVAIPISGSEAIREAKFSGKHSENLLFILDEGDAIPDEVYRGIESCMSGGHARLLIMFNPRAETGAPYRMIRDGRAHVIKLSAFSHPNVVTGEDRIPGAVNRQTTVRRINEWCRPLTSNEQPDSECFKLPNFLKGAVAFSQSGQEYPPLKPGYYKIEDPAFAYMVLGEYPAQAANQLISREWLNNARARWDSYVSQHGEIPPAETQAIAGFDVAEYGSDKNCLIFRYGGFVTRPITWGGMDPFESASKAAAQCEGKDLLRVCVDSTGVGAGVPGAMRDKKLPIASVKVATKATEKTEIGEFYQLRDQIWWACREWLRTDPGAMLPPDEHLIEELATPTYEIINGKIKVMKKDTQRELLGRSPDKADALVLTFYKPPLLFPEFE
jgi:hypothetical protein